MSLLWMPLRSFCKYFNPVFSKLEQKQINQFGNQMPNFQPVFIIGPPRSGSTILYQYLTNNLLVTYISNLADACREKPMTGLLLHDRIFDSKPHNTFTSKFGHTNKLIAPAESILWRNWLPRGQHYITPQMVSQQKKQQMQKFFFAVLNKFQRPWIIKNLAFGMRLSLIKELFPDAIIIYIKRDTFYNAQSLYLAYQKHKVPDSQVWSIRPPGWEQLKNLPLEQKVVAQIYYIEQYIERHINKFDNHVIIKFEDFVNQPQKWLENIKKLTGAKARPGAKNIKIYNSNKLKLNQQQAELLRNSIKKYYEQQS